jgi:hypothetical protein
MFKKLLGYSVFKNHKSSGEQNPLEGPVNLYNLAICCIVKDENEYLEEWINYHLKTGVQHFYIYDNESSTPIYDTLADLKLLEHVTVTSIEGVAKQVEAYADCLKNFGTESRWIAFIDVDEFIVAKTTGGNLVAFLKDYEKYGGLAINWLVFGSNGHIKRTGRPQLESFKLRANEDHKVNTHIKSIVQPRYVKAAFNAHFFKYIGNKFCVNENFMSITGAFSGISVNKIQLNHYFCRSAEEFNSKIKRGRGDTGTVRTMEDFYIHDRIADKIEDTTILEIFK